MSNSSTKQSPGTPSEGLPTLKTMKSRLSKVDRHHLERILKRGSTCLMFEDETPITVTLKDVKVERKEGLDKAEIYVAIYDVDTGIFIADISSYELLKGAKAAENAGYYEVDCYLGFLNIDKKDCSVNVRWTTGEETFEPLNQVKQDDPVGLADFAKKQGVENNPNFKWVAEVLKEARPKNEEEALRSSKQSEIISKEINNIKTYNTFRQLLFGEPKKRQYVIDVEWNDGNKTTESLSFMKKLDPVGLANWAKENGFLAHSRFSWAVKYLLKDTTKTSDDNKHRSRKKPKHRHTVAPKSDKPLEYLQYRNENDQHQILTRWNPSQEKWESLETLKSIDPTGLALWAKSKSMLNNPEFKWAKTVAELWTWDENESSQEESSIADDISEEEYMDVYEQVSDDEGISLTRDGQWVRYFLCK